MTGPLEIVDLKRRHIPRMVPLRRATTELHQHLHPGQFKREISETEEGQEIRRHMPRFLPLRRRERYAIGAFEGPEMRGYLLYSVFTRSADSLLRSGRVVMVNDIAVDRDHRGQGVGLALIEGLRERVDDGVAREIIAIIWEGNELSTALFTRAGFKPTFTYHSLPLGDDDGA